MIFTSLDAVTVNGPGLVLDIGHVAAQVSMQLTSSPPRLGCQVDLEVSLDGVNWFAGISAFGTDGRMVALNIPFRWARANLVNGSFPGFSVTANIAAPDDVKDK